MCLATPCKIIEIKGQKGIVESTDHTHEVDLSLLKNPKPGDYVFVNSGLAISTIPESEALKIIEVIKDLPHEH